MNTRTAGLSGIAATILFWVALFGFGAAQTDYSHFTSAVSELGVLGVPNGTAWNVFGFIVPGIMLGVCGAGLASAVDGRRGLLWWLLVLSGLAFAGTGVIPAEMLNGSPNLQSPFTLGHLVMSSLSGILWLAAALLFPRRAALNPSWNHVLPAGIALGLLAVTGFAAQIFAQVFPYLDARPGLAQRLTFATYFLWFFATSWYLLSAASRRDSDNHEKLEAQ